MSRGKRTRGREVRRLHRASSWRVGLLRPATLALSLAACSPSAPSSPTPAPAVIPEAAGGLLAVQHVVDGDTVDLLIDGEAQRVRLKGINTPEKGECMAAEATAALTGMVSGGVILAAQGRGDRGRLLGYLTDSSGRLIQEELVERGLALAYPYGKRDLHTDRLAAAQVRAEEAARGQFAAEACGPAQVPKGRVRITAVDADPEGDDLQAGGGESVTIVGPAGLSLSGWTLKDTSASHRLRFGADAALGSDGRLVVYTACGPSRPGRLYWCKKGSAVWNNSGDTAFLQDPRGNLVSKMDWVP